VIFLSQFNNFGATLLIASCQRKPCLQENEKKAQGIIFDDKKKKFRQ
jgi:hypothetical protein